jgi:seryl-tRNA synthetase
MPSDCRENIKSCVKMPEELKLMLECKFSLSEKPQNAEEFLSNLVDEANNVVLVTGIPPNRVKSAAKIIKWQLKGNELQIKVVSGPLVRAPTAVIRFRKLLAEKLGKKFRVGVRGIEIKNFKIEIPIRKPTRSALERIRKLNYVDTVETENGRLTLNLKALNEAELKRNISERTLTMVKAILAEEAAPAPAAEQLQVVRQSRIKKQNFEEDPAVVGVELGWFKEFPGRGQWIYTTPYAKLMEIIEGLIVEEIINKLDFQPFMLPKLIPLEVMRRMPGYLEDIPEGMYYVCPPPRDPEAFAKFKETVKLTKQIPKGQLKAVLKEPDYVLAPAQCEPFWYFFSHETVRCEDLPVKLYDRSGWTYRWEGGGVEGLVRVQEFRRVELGYVGTPEQIIEIRDAVRDSTLHVVDKILDLEWRVVAAAPFYMKGGRIGDVTKSENVAAYDIEVYLPYRGEREKAEWLEITACFIHKDKFVKSFSIHEAKSRPIWTGCTGFGVSRWAASFLATYGFDTSTWPEAVKKQFGTYKLPKTLLWPKKTL